MDQIIINTDGGARGNPGPAAIGYVIKFRNQLIFQHGQKIGETTNNVAEYQAVIEVLQWLISHRIEVIETTQQPKDTPLQLQFNLDSNLVVNQLKGVFKIKQLHLKDLQLKVHQLLRQLNAVATFTHVYREYNREADALLNAALDA